MSISKGEVLLLTQALRLAGLLPGSLIGRPPPLPQTLPTSTASIIQAGKGVPLDREVCPLSQAAASESPSFPQTTVSLAAADVHSPETISAGRLFSVSAHSSNTLACSPLSESGTGKSSLLSNFTPSCCCWTLLPSSEGRITSGQAPHACN